MRHRLFAFISVSAFFAVMNVLLWRSEFASNSRFGAPVPPAVVWEKLLTSPDNSFLEIRHRGVKIGRAHWVATINESVPPADEAEDSFEDEIPPEGMVRTVTGYTLDFDGNVSVDELTRLRFSVTLRFGTNQDWREFSTKLTVKPFSIEVGASAITREIRLVTQEEEAVKERVLKFDELRNPEKLLREFGGPVLPTALAGLGLSLPQTDAAAKSVLTWQARNDRLQVGRNDVRVYRLEATLMSHYRAVFYVSPVGEMLRVELPDEIILTNEALTTL